jgi:hypothetical protein
MYTEITTVEAAFKACDADPAIMPVLTGIPERFHQPIIEHYKLMVITEAINERKEPDYREGSDWKYEPRFWIEATDEKPSGVGFSDSYYVCWYSATGVGSRLCFLSEEQYDHAMEHFKQNYLDYHIKK